MDSVQPPPSPGPPPPATPSLNPPVGSPGAPPAARLGSGVAGFARAIGFVAGLMILGIVFATGLAIGAVTVLAGSMGESPIVTELYRDGDRNTVVVIPVEGIIDPFQASKVRLLADEAMSDSSVRAVVLRVDSPGGGIAPSDQIWYQVRRLHDKGLPIVSSYGGLAASGGYYISCATDHIVAEPTCITGSIGVIAQTFIFKSLLDKVGIEPVTLLATDSPEKDVGNPFREWTDKDRQQYRDMLDAAYDIFNQRVQDGRGHAIPDPALVDALADGSIYTAQEALDAGLVDSIGYLDDAVAEAERLAGLVPGRATVVILHERVSLLDSLLGVSASPQLRGSEDLRTLVNDLGSPRVMYLMR